jgi:DNA-binding NtrC family response regulator
MERLPGELEDDGLSTVSQLRYSPSAVPTTTFTIRVADGPDRGATMVLDGSHASRLLVGQSPACDLRLSDPGVSRRHLAVETVEDKLRVLDLGSTNGTFIGSTRIVEAYVEGGESLRMASTTLYIERADRAPSTALPAATHFGRVVGWSREMRRLYPLCERLALASVPVIIEGETGTGKEVLAESLHEEGPRAQGPFVVFDCTAVPPNLVESELFGHERGAFTGAVAARKGLFEQAHGGTLLIDEIGDLELALQPKLLRALERGELRRVGGDRAIRVDVRVLAATRRDLDREVAAGRFRDDLFHRLAVTRIELPPLRARKGDIGPLVRHFVAQLGGDPRALPDALVARWEDYPWPGNVRELRNAVARQMALGELAESGSGPQESEHPPAGDFLAAVLAERLPIVTARQRVVDELERRYVEQVLAEHGGNVARAAAASGIGRRYFHMIRTRLQK